MDVKQGILERGRQNSVRFPGVHSENRRARPFDNRGPTGKGLLFFLCFTLALGACTDDPPRSLDREPGFEVRLVLRGDERDAVFGTSVAGCGDVNRDGHDDLLIGAVYHDGAGEDAGRALVVSGRDGSVLHTLTGDGAFFELGYTWLRASSGSIGFDGGGLAPVVGYRLSL